MYAREQAANLGLILYFLSRDLSSLLQAQKERDSHFDAWKQILADGPPGNLKPVATTPMASATKKENGTPKSGGHSGEKSALSKLPLSTGGNSLLPSEEGRPLTIFDGELTSFVAYALSTK